MLSDMHNRLAYTHAIDAQSYECELFKCATLLGAFHGKQIVIDKSYNHTVYSHVG